MKYSLTIVIALSFFGIFLFQSCNLSEHKSGFGKQDEIQIRKMIMDYNSAWLRGDSAAILNLFADSATLVPSGLKPIVGKKDIIKFWWPNDSSKTKINSYKIELLKAEGSGEMAYTYENGKLDWSYEKGDFKMSKKQESYEITLFRKNRNGQWKIVKRMWTDLKEAR